MNMPDEQCLAHQLEQEMTDRYGPLMGGENLCRYLGYPSSDAFRQALSRGTIPVPVFSIPSRRGKFALVKDVAVWLASHRAKASRLKNSTIKEK